jgi:imidazolonepropionase-like amidohydrolase
VAERTLIAGAVIFDGTGSPPFPGDVLVEGDRIAAVQRGGTALPCADARTIDGRGRTLMPGLIDGHAHITYPNAIDRSYPTMYPPAAIETTLMTVHNARVLLDHGFTSAYSAGAIKPGIETKLRDEIAAGRIAGPRLRAASMEFYFPGDPEARPMPTDPAGVRQFVRESAAEGADIVKLFFSGLTGQMPQNDDQLVLSDAAAAAAQEEAEAHGLMTSAHVRPAAGIKQALRHGVRVLYHVEDLDDEGLELMAERRTEIFCGPTISGIALAAARSGAHQARAQARLDRYRETVARMRSRGIRVLPFGDYGFPGRAHGANARDLGYFVRHLGVPPADTLAAATKLGGEQMNEPVGTIAPGYFADLLLVEGDPLADVDVLTDANNLAMIMQRGALYKLRAASEMKLTTVAG